MLKSLLETFDAIRAVIEYDREDLTLGGGVFALKSKELDMKSSNKTMINSNTSGSLSMHGRTEKRESKSYKKQERSKSRSKKPLRCFICHKECHFKCNYPKRRKGYQDKEIEGSLRSRRV